MKNHATQISLSATLMVVSALLGPSQADAEDLAARLRKLDVSILTQVERENAREMVARDIERRRLSAIERENRAWSAVQSREDWERFRDVRLNALRASLGPHPTVPQDLKIEVTGRLKGDGYRIENIVLESRPGIFVTANLYLPSKLPQHAMPAILLSHSHHAPKTQGELQDMGMTWARQGWAVLVMDHLGHGERRQHPFVSSDDYPAAFRVGRQDYYFRYNVGLQLQLVGESLMGWMAWDLMRGVDLLCARDDVDRHRIILVGSVAGGGDPAGVAAALDPRIAAVAPFNFGGPQPDYAIPADAENEFYYFGVAYWETTRCLRLGGRDGFAHWNIVGAVAPRRLIYAHEFSWQREQDPVWPRLERVFGLYAAREHLGVATGRGVLKGRPPESTHCSNVGAFHRSRLYPHWQLWFDMEPPLEFQQRRSAEELICLTPTAAKTLNLEPLFELAGQLGAERVSAARHQLQALDHVSRIRKLRKDWSRLLGNIRPAQEPKVVRSTKEMIGNTIVDRVLLEVEPDILVPLVLIRLASDKRSRRPTVVVVARAGKQRILDVRWEEIAELLEGGAVICLSDLRGLGESSAGSSIGPRSIGTKLSSRDQVLGQTLLGSRLRDLRSVLRYIRDQEDTGGIAVWGDSLAEVNPIERSEVVPHGVENPNVQAEPSGGLLALLGALFEDDVQAVYATGTFASFLSLLNSQFLYVPHDAVIPGVLTAGDVCDIAAAIAPRSLKMHNLVDGLNRNVLGDELSSAFAPALDSYRRSQAIDKLSISTGEQDNVTAWLLRELRDL